jgi:hypothetical protein
MGRITLHAEQLAAFKRNGARSGNLKSPVETHKEGVAFGSVFGPPNLKSVAAIHREAPTIPLDPPGNGPDVTQIKKIRQQKSKLFCNGTFLSHTRRTEKFSNSFKGRPVTQIEIS